MQATTRDYARFGQFILDGARIDGQSIVADGWLEAATRKQVDIGQPGSGYGYQCWTQDNGPFNALGLHGQQSHIDPARRLVVAINSAWPVAEFIEESLPARVALLDRDPRGDRFGLPQQFGKIVGSGGPVSMSIRWK